MERSFYDGSLTSSDISEAINPYKTKKKPMETEKRNVQISLEQAREWYNSNDAALIALALSTFKLSELVTSYKEVLDVSSDLGLGLTILPKTEIDKHTVNAKLEVIATHFNEGWRMRPGEVGYFISQLENPISPDTNGKYHITVFRTVGTMSAGVVYFRREKDAEKAILMLGKELDKLFE